MMRVYPLEHDNGVRLTQEQIAVAFAMTSRSSRPFDDLVRQVSTEKASDFHERWVLGYGHSSIAEHAVLHLAVESISRLACDSLEDNRLGSYTERSSRYQTLEHFYVPDELEGAVRQAYIDACWKLFNLYSWMVNRVTDFLKEDLPQWERGTSTWPCAAFSASKRPSRPARWDGSRSSGRASWRPGRAAP